MALGTSHFCLSIEQESVGHQICRKGSGTPFLTFCRRDSLLENLDHVRDKITGEEICMLLCWSQNAYMTSQEHNIDLLDTLTSYISLSLLDGRDTRQLFCCLCIQAEVGSLENTANKNRRMEGGLTDWRWRCLYMQASPRHKLCLSQSDVVVRKSAGPAHKNQSSISSSDFPLKRESQ